jgi:hypothetical protein
MFRLASALFTLAVALSIACPAAAEGARSADALFNEGAALLKAGKLEEACGKLAESQSVEPAIGTLGLLAYCHEQSGKLATAMREYGEVAELAHLASQAEREKVARERVAELAPRVTRLAVALSEPNDEVEVYLDARRLGASELGASTPVDPGSFELRVSAKGFEPWQQALTIPADGSTLRVVVPRLARVAPVVATVPKPQAPSPSPERGLRRPAAWASLGVGALGFAVGGYFGLSAITARADAKPHCDGNRCDQTGVDARERAIDRARFSTIGFAVGAVGAATGAILLFTDRPEQPRQRASVTPLPGGVAFSWERRF